MMKRVHMLLLMVPILFFFYNGKTLKQPRYDYEVIQAYQDLWNETDNEQRLESIRQIWNAESIFRDKNNRATGPEELNAIINDFREQYPDATLTGDILFSTGKFHTWVWHIYDENNQEILTGQDVAELNSDKEIVRIVSFIYE